MPPPPPPPPPQPRRRAASGGAASGRKPGRRCDLKPPPKAEDFTPGAVNRAILAETLQHPMTIMPAAISAVGGLYIGLMELDPQAFAVTFLSGLVAAGAWVFNYFVRGEKLAERHVERLRERRDGYQQERARSVEEEWAEVGHPDGEKQARELREAYERLDELLETRFARTQSPNLQRLRVLAEDTFQEGAAILRQALEAYRALGQVDHRHLERELFEWRAELGRLRRAPAAEREARQAALDTRIATHERRLELYYQQRKSVEELLAESEVLESALESTYLEAVDLGSAEAIFTRGESASRLERAVAAARRVEERLRNLGQPTREDKIYLAAGEGEG